MFKKVYMSFFILWLGVNSAFALDAYDSKQALVKQELWVDSIFQELNLEQKIGQLFMVHTFSQSPSQEIQQIESLIRKYNIGGIVFFQGGPVSQARLTNRYQRISQVPLMIGMDGERGLGGMLDSTIAFPGPLSLAAIQDQRYIFNLAEELNHQFEIMGVHINFNPLVDQDKKLIQPLTKKEFSNPQIVPDYLGYKVGQNNDKTPISLDPLPALVSNQQSLTDQSFSLNLQKPIVTAPFLVPPAMNDLKFTGPLNSKTILKNYSSGEIEIHALNSGYDILVASADLPKAFKAIKKAVLNHEISRENIETKVKNVLRAKYQVGLARYQPVNLDNLYLKLNHAKAKVLQKNLYEQSITVVKNASDLMPLKILDTLRFASISLGASKTTRFQKRLDNYISCTHFQLEKNSSKEQFEQLYQQLLPFDLVLVGLHGLKINAEQDQLLYQEEMAFLKSLSQAKPTITTVFGSVTILKALTELDHLICTYEEDPLLETLVPEVIFGAVAAQGRLPVTISEKLQQGFGITTPYLARMGYSIPEQVGMDSKVLNKIDLIMQEAIENKATPGGQVLVARNGKIIFERAYGYYTYGKTEQVTHQTLYDVASVTKVVATLQAIMFLEENGVIELDKKASFYLPELIGTNKEDLVIKDILTHQAGLIPFIPFWKRTLDDAGYIPSFYSSFPTTIFNQEVVEGLYGVSTLPDSLWQWTIDSDLLRKPRYKRNYVYRYSDLGFFILHRLARHVLNQNLKDFLEQNFYNPLGLSNLGYLPLYRFPKARIAPTEEDNYFRHRLIRGNVHDPGAAMFGGIAGHAGIFSNAHDLAILLQMNLQGGYYGGINYLRPETITKFTSKQFDENRRGLGWDKPSFEDDFNVTSRFASVKTFGHTGFTGTAVWVDPEFDLIYVFLSNRVYPEASNIKLIKSNVRTRIHDVIYEAIWNFERYYR